MKKKITHESKRGFNQSSKIIAHKLGLNASIIFSSLIYKHNYWFDEDRLIELEGEHYFYITYTNLQAETTLNQNAIKKAIKVLKKANLVQVKRKGVPATNHYCLNHKVIKNFESIHEEEYQSWVENLNKKAKVDKDRFPEQNKVSKPSQILEYSNKIIEEDLETEIVYQIWDTASYETLYSSLS